MYRAWRKRFAPCFFWFVLIQHPLQLTTSPYPTMRLDVLIHLAGKEINLKTVVELRKIMQ